VQLQVNQFEGAYTAGGCRTLLNIQNKNDQETGGVGRFHAAQQRRERRRPPRRSAQYTGGAAVFFAVMATVSNWYRKPGNHGCYIDSGTDIAAIRIFDSIYRSFRTDGNSNVILVRVSRGCLCQIDKDTVLRDMLSER